MTIVEEKRPRFAAELNAQFAESSKPEQAVKANLRGLGYELHPTNQSP
jgi:type I restriction enzyme M protein